MPYLMIRHKVADFTAWKAAFDAHRPVREAAGLADTHVFRDADDPANVVLQFRAADLDRARAFASSPDVREVMTRAGVTGRPEISVLTD